MVCKLWGDDIEFVKILISFYKNKLLWLLLELNK